MKKLLTILCLVLLVSCSNEVPEEELVERQGITYETNSTTPFTGSSVSYHENGQLKSRENYKDGKEDGLYERFYGNGQLDLRENYKNGKKDGLYESYYENGKLYSRGIYKDGKEDGNSDLYQNGNTSKHL